MSSYRQYITPVLIGVILALAFVAIRRREAMVPSPGGPPSAATSGPPVAGTPPSRVDRSGQAAAPRTPPNQLAHPARDRQTPGTTTAPPHSNSDATREVVIEGLIRIEEPEEKQELPQGISPFGLREMTGSEEAALRSVLVEGPAGEVAQVDEGGAFRIKVLLAEGQEQVALGFTSPFLVYGEHPGDTMPVRIPAGAARVDIEVMMTPGMSFQPMFAGKPITPEDMSNPEVQRAFFEQSSAFLDRYFPHSGNGAPGTSDPVELTIPRPGGVPPGMPTPPAQP